MDAGFDKTEGGLCIFSSAVNYLYGGGSVVTHFSVSPLTVGDPLVGSISVSPDSNADVLCRRRAVPALLAPAASKLLL